MLMIRDLDNNGCFLKVYSDEQGDVYVALGPDACCRIGGPASGHTIPVGIRRKLMALANEFEKYPGVLFEEQAYEIEQKELGDYKFDFQREQVIQNITENLQTSPFTVEFEVKKKPNGIKIIYEVTQERMDEMMKKAKEGGGE